MKIKTTKAWDDMQKQDLADYTLEGKMYWYPVSDKTWSHISFEWGEHPMIVHGRPFCSNGGRIGLYTPEEAAGIEKDYPQLKEIRRKFDPDEERETMK